MKAFGKPVRVINDAAMQAIGSYEGGRMLFLGLGTGLGAALILDGTVEPTEIGHMPYKRGRTFEDYVGEAGRERLGNRKWRKSSWLVEVVRLGTRLCRVGRRERARLKKLPAARASATTATRSSAVCAYGGRPRRDPRPHAAASGAGASP